MRRRFISLQSALARLGALVCIASALLPLSVHAEIQYGLTSRGEHYAVGGIGADEDARLHIECQVYSLCVRTASVGSGAFVTDVHVVISDRADGQVVFDQVLQAPWLLIDLKPGAYWLRASMGAQTHEETTEIGADGHRDVVVRFKLRPGDQ